MLVLWITFWGASLIIKTLAILLGEHPCIVNVLLGPVTVHYREVLLFYNVAVNAVGVLYFLQCA